MENASKAKDVQAPDDKQARRSSHCAASVFFTVIAFASVAAVVGYHIGCVRMMNTAAEKNCGRWLSMDGRSEFVWRGETYSEEGWRWKLTESGEMTHGPVNKIPK